MKTISTIIIAFIMTITASCNHTSATTRVEHSSGIVAYYPQFTSIDLAVEQMPAAGADSVIFCCEAAFTGELLDSFKHTNIADNHIAGGTLYKGYTCPANTGAFSFFNDGSWSFSAGKRFDLSRHPIMAFCQRLLIINGVTQPVWNVLRDKRTIYRALCEKNGQLCLVQTTQVDTYARFIALLEQYQVDNAIYLDMGAGWNYAWYRDSNDKIIEIFPESKQAPNYRYRTNWLVFKR